MAGYRAWEIRMADCKYTLDNVYLNFSTLIDIFGYATRTYAGNTAFRIKRDNVYEEYSYERVGDEARALARYLRGMGIGPKKKVALFSENRPEWGITYFAVLLTGAVIVPIDALLNENGIDHIINESGSVLLFCSGSLYDRVGDLGPRIKGIKKVILLDQVDTARRNCLLYAQAVAKGRELRKPLPGTAKKDDTAALIYTSGTTGSSKGVMLSHWNITADVLGLGRMIRYDEHDVFLSVLPLHHTFECTTGLIVPFMRGASITYAESLASKRIIANIRETGVTIMMGVPLLYEKMVNGINRAISEKPFHLRVLVKTMMGMVKGVRRMTRKNYGKKVFRSLREKAGLGTLRLLISGGAPLSPWVASAFEHLGIRFLNGYGMTETAPVLTVNVESDTDNTTVGYPVPGIELAIHEPDASGVGELKARGDFVMQGYYKNKAATAEIIRDGWLHTSDLARFDSHGRVIISGRCKNLIVTHGGKNVYPEELEMYLNDSPYILESLVLGKPISAENRGEEVVAYIVPDYEYIEDSQHAGSRTSAEKIVELIEKEVQAVNGQFPQYKRIKDFFIREEEFPKTSTRKIKRYLFQQADHRLGDQ